MRNTRKKNRPISDEAIARMAGRGRDVSSFFSKSGRMMKSVKARTQKSA